MFFYASGYSPLHYSALWGQLNTLKTLVELGADIQATNFRGERAKEVASRYSKMDCVAYLSWAGKGRFKESLSRKCVHMGSRQLF